MTMFKLQFQQCESVPRLAWVACVRKNSDTVEVAHGTWVDTADGLFVEGAWDGDYDDGGFMEAASFHGTGGKITDDGAFVVAAPTHPQERIWLIRRADSVSVSNSLVGLLRKCDASLCPKYGRHHSDVQSTAYGLHQYVRSIPLRDDGRVEMYCTCNIRIGPDLTVSELPKREVDDFQSYEAYKKLLSQTTNRIFHNADHARRKRQYKPLCTMSGGFDSNACAAIANECGCGDAVTFAGKIADDSGREVAAQLGMTWRECNRHAYLQSATQFIEADIVSGGRGTAGLYFASLEEIAPSKIIVVGYYGDVVWDPAIAPVWGDPEFTLGSATSGCTYTEFRLRVGCTMLYLPFVGAEELHSIHRVGNDVVQGLGDDDQKAFAGNGYARPIPIRILTEAGVDRSTYGQQKMAAGANAQYKFGRLRKCLPVDVLAKKLGVSRWRIFWQMQRRPIAKLFSDESFEDLWSGWLQSNRKSFTTYAMLWGIEKCGQRYNW